MMAAYVEQLGPPAAIRFGSLPDPVPGPGEVLVRVGAVAVNHVDTLVRSGAFATEAPLPFVVGRDLVGTVEAVGAEVSRFRPGQRVWCNSLGHDGRQGSFSELAAVAEDRLYPLPEGVDPVAAVVVAHTAATAHVGLFREAGLVGGETLLVWGAGGGVGSAVVQLAAHAGATVVAVDRADNEQWCLRCGAAEFVDRARPDVADVVAGLLPAGAAVAWDNTGRHDFDVLLPLVAKRGRVVLAAGFAARPPLPVGAVYTRDARLLGFAVSNASVDDLARAAADVNRGLSAGWLEGRVRATLPLAATRQAHEMQEHREPGDPPGRIVLVP